MEEEVYRNTALALANMNVGHPVPKGQSHINDVVGKAFFPVG